MLGACERFGCLPSALYEEDARLLQLLQLEELGGSREMPEEVSGHGR